MFCYVPRCTHRAEGLVDREKLLRCCRSCIRDDPPRLVPSHPERGFRGIGAPGAGGGGRRAGGWAEAVTFEVAASVLSGLFILAMLPAPGNSDAWAMYPWIWHRLTETDADKAQRLLVRSQQLLEQARHLTVRTQEVEKAIDDEFARRLRLVSGDEP